MSNLVVQTNVLALNSHRNLKVIGNKTSQASARLSSGYRINSAADDASGLAISEKMRAQIRGLDMASKNTQDGISLVQTAEGGLQEIDNMLQRIRELSVQASNDTNDYDTNDRKKIQEEIDQLTAGIDNMADQVEFNAKKLLDGSLMDSLTQSELLGDIEQKLTASVGGYGNAISDGAGELGALYTQNTGTLTDVTDITKSAVHSAANVKTALATGTTSDTTDDSIVYEFTLQTDVTGGAAKGWTKSIHVNSLSDSTDEMACVSSLTSTLVDATTLNGIAAADYATADAMKAKLKQIDEYIVEINKALSAVEGGAGGATLGALESDKTDASRMRQDLMDMYAGQLLVDTQNSAHTALSAVEGDGLWFQTGANSQQGINVGVGSIKTDILGIGDGQGNSKIDINQAPGVAISAFIDVVDDALQYVTAQRAQLGAVQNRMEFTKSSLDISSENLSAAESRIRDADMAKEMMKMTSANVLQQAGVSMLSQANQAPQSVLQLLG